MDGQPPTTGRLLSDRLGRERAIRIVRQIIETDGEGPDGVPDPDGLAVKIVLALDYADRDGR